MGYEAACCVFATAQTHLVSEDPGIHHTSCGRSGTYDPRIAGRIPGAVNFGVVEIPLQHQISYGKDSVRTEDDLPEASDSHQETATAEASTGGAGALARRGLSQLCKAENQSRPGVSRYIILNKTLQLKCCPRSQVGASRKVSWGERSIARKWQLL